MVQGLPSAVAMHERLGIGPTAVVWRYQGLLGDICGGMHPVSEGVCVEVSSIPIRTAILMLHTPHIQPFGLDGKLRSLKMARLKAPKALEACAILFSTSASTLLDEATTEPR